MMATQAMEPPIIHNGRFLADGRIVTASPEMLEIHRRCGGGDADVLAIPGLPSLIRRAASLDMPLSASVLVADGPRNVSYWARAVPVDGAVDVQLFDWDYGRAELPRSLDHAVREHDFMRASSDWLWEIDAELRLVTLSPSATAAFGRPAVLLNGAPLRDVLEPIPTERKAGVGFREGADPDNWFQDRIVRIVGQEPPRFFRMDGRPFYDAGNLAGWRGVAVEVPEPAKTTETPVEEAIGAEAAQAEDGNGFPVSDTDMLRAPIDQITRRAEAMHAQQFGHLKSVYAGYAGDIASAARHLRTLIDDVFDVAAIDSGTMNLSMEKVDLTTLAEEARAIVSQRAEASGSRIIWRTPPASLIVHADRGRTLQILINLMQNAVKFAGNAGPIRLLLEAGDSEAYVRVDDLGAGVPATDRERVFSKFERLHPQDVEGTGLGLYISRALARAMGGEIIVSDSPEGGARFSLILSRA